MTSGSTLARVMTFAALVGGLAGPAAATDNRYDDMRSAAVKRCEAIDGSQYQSGLFFNPDGYRSYYLRSLCFQNAAVEFRDETLCAKVKERWSLFSSSWGYSGKNCRRLVVERVSADRKTLGKIKDRYARGAVTLRDFTIERNGNGRDFDVIPSLGAGYAHAYTLRFEIIGADSAGESALLGSSGLYLHGGDNIRIFIRQTDIRKRFHRFELGHPYLVRATLLLNVGDGGQAGKWSETFIERVFPAAGRSQILVKEVTF